MASGISNIFRHGLVRTLYDHFKRRKVLSENRDKNLRLSFGCNIKNVAFGNEVYIGQFTTLINSGISDHSYVGPNSTIRDTQIGKFCSVGPGVKIVMGKHPTDFVSTHPAFYAIDKPFSTFAAKQHYQEYEHVEIGHDVWIGEDVVIPGGVKIGTGAIIATRSVVTKDVEAYSIVGGIPAKHIKYRFEEPMRTQLLQSKWWEKEIQWISQNHLLFHDPALLLKNL